MTIFVKVFDWQNGFLLITQVFKTSWTQSPVATPHESTMSRRSKESKHGVFFYFFGFVFFVGPHFFVVFFVGPNFFPRYFGRFSF